MQPLSQITNPSKSTGQIANTSAKKLPDDIFWKDEIAIEKIAKEEGMRRMELENKERLEKKRKEDKKMKLVGTI